MKTAFICSVFLGNIKQAFDKKPDLSNLLLDDFFKGEIQKCQVRPCNKIFCLRLRPCKKKICLFSLCLELNRAQPRFLFKSDNNMNFCYYLIL